MIRTISASGTFAQKYVLPLIWVGVAGGLNALMWIGHAFAPPPTLGARAAMLLLLLGPLVFLPGLRRLKRVRMSDDGLLISNYVREIFVPFGEIESVSSHTKVYPFQPIEVRFRTPTAFGERIRFVPRPRHGFMPWLAPAVQELRDRVDAARRAQPGRVPAGRP
jgi:hypothetical protein